MTFNSGGNCILLRIVTMFAVSLCTFFKMQLKHQILGKIIESEIQCFRWSFLPPYLSQTKVNKLYFYYYYYLPIYVLSFLFLYNYYCIVFLCIHFYCLFIIFLLTYSLLTVKIKLSLYLNSMFSNCKYYLQNKK